MFRNVREYGLPLKRRLSPDRPFGLGLRLSDRESREIRIAEFAEFLESNGLYVSLINGYSYGAFHRTPVKSEVFSPDWRHEERVRYTLRLAKILERLLPENGEGGISTAPLCYKPRVDSGDHDRIVGNLARVAEELIRIERESGKRIRLEIEPEPDGLLETSAEVVSFFDNFGKLLDHICVCFDTCHFAVEYEQPDEALDALAAAGIRVGRVQLSSALRVSLPDDSAAAQLRAFDDPVYLHQVIERRSDGTLRRFRDLGDALATIDDPAPREWRIHFHVPLFADGFGVLESTQEQARNVLRRLRRQPFTNHLEIETYTWDVLPPALRLDLTDSIEREYRWVLEELCERPLF